MDKQHIIEMYKAATDEADRELTVEVLADEFNVAKATIRQILQDAKVYRKKEGKTQKQQYARALWAATGIATEKEWMKLTLKTQKELMELIKKWSK